MFFCSALQAVVVAAAVRCASFVIWPFLAATRYCCRCSCARNCVLRRWSVQQTKELDILLSHFLILHRFYFFVIVYYVNEAAALASSAKSVKYSFVSLSVTHDNSSSSNKKNNADLAQLLRSSLCCNVRVVRSNFLSLLFLHVRSCSCCCHFVCVRGGRALKKHSIM